MCTGDAEDGAGGVGVGVCTGDAADEELELPSACGVCTGAPTSASTAADGAGGFGTSSVRSITVAFFGGGNGGTVGGSIGKVRCPFGRLIGVCGCCVVAEVVSSSS